jgi:hypothetical protein
LTIEAEVVGIGVEEPLRVDRSGEELEAFLLEGLQVAGADARLGGYLGQLEPATDSRLAKAGAELEHGPGCNSLTSRSRPGRSASVVSKEQKELGRARRRMPGYGATMGLCLAGRARATS